MWVGWGQGQVINFRLRSGGQKGVGQAGTLGRVFQADGTSGGQYLKWQGAWLPGAMKVRPVWLGLSEESDGVRGGPITQGSGG